MCSQLRPETLDSLVSDSCVGTIGMSQHASLNIWFMDEGTVQRKLGNLFKLIYVVGRIGTTSSV